MLEKPIEGEQCCGKNPSKCLEHLEHKRESGCCFTSTEAAGFNVKIKNGPSLLVMRKTILTSKIRKAVLSAKAFGCLNFPVSATDPVVSPLQIGLLMCPAVPVSEYFIQTFPLGGTSG